MDLDIDTVSLLTYVLNKDGCFAGWSPYFNLDSEQMMAESVKLDYPTGEKVKHYDFDKKYSELGDNAKIKAVETFATNILRGFDFNKNGVLRDKLTESDPIAQLEAFRARIQLINAISVEGLPEIETNIQLQNALKRNGIKDPVQVLKHLEKYVNKHNLYNHNIENYTKNFLVQKLYNVAINIANQKQATTSVDKTTSEPKSIADKYSEAKNLVRYSTPGNVTNMYQSIEDAQVGKEVIGICAVGLKTFFAITQYTNTILNTGDEAAIKELLSRTFTFNGKNYYAVANADTRGARARLNGDILNKLNKLNEVGKTKDACVMISALLSLATDNAKELCLAKLNANPKLAGMYIFGLTLGIPFEELGQLLMSDIGNTVSQYLKGSIVTNSLSFQDVGDVIEFIRNPLIKIRRKFTSKKMHDRAGSVWSTLNSTASQVQSVGNLQRFIEEIFADNMFVENIENSWRRLSELRKYVSGTSDDVQLQHQLIDLIEDTLLAKRALKLNDSKYQEFIELYQGAAEMRDLGAVLGINQGSKAANIDSLAYTDKVETLARARTKAMKKAGKTENDPNNVPRVKFADIFGPNAKPELLQEAVNAYPTFMFNPYKIVSSVKHYRSYLDGFAANHSIALEGSIRYRTIYNTLDRITQAVGNVDLEKRVHSMDNMIDTKLIQQYFIQENAHFYLPAGMDLIELKSNSGYFSTSATPVSETTKVYLANDGAKATFKQFMEQYVIPRLKEGYISETEKIGTLSNNEFIAGLRPNSYTKNLSRNASISWTLNLNMSPKRDSEDASLLARYIQEFDNLTGTFSVDGHEIPIKDLFYWYNLISYNSRAGQGTLTRIMDNYQMSDEAIKFRKVELGLDRAKVDLPFTEDEIVNTTAQVESRFGTSSKAIYEKNKQSLKVEKKLRTTSQEEGVTYQLDGRVANIDSNLFLTTPAKGDLQIISFDGIEVHYDTSQKKFKTIKSVNKTLLAEELNGMDNLLVIYNPELQEYQIDKDRIKSMINC